MKFTTLAKIAGALALTMGLAGCIDMTNDIYVTSSTTAKATITSTMTADIYSMVKAGGNQGDDPFCKGEGETLTENEDGSGTCVAISEGDFADLKFDDGGSKPVITTNDDGTVKIAIATKDMMGDLGADDDPETAAMMKQMFEGHFLTIRFGGAEIIDSNMEAAADSDEYVEIKIPFLGLLDGTAELPEELYAVIQP
ncbi:MAG: hypothetical protein ABIY37_09010 [Devosia sp.]